jgi:hypothetical protein
VEGNAVQQEEKEGDMAQDAIDRQEPHDERVETRRVEWRLPVDLLERLKADARHEYRSVPNLVIKLLREHYGRAGAGGEQ